ncbi:PAN domain-containing protein [Daeguia caeni]|uniref:PAN domain-containing protein n=1 Tax=Daeguia caeni TaxID=439612 RepID=A0ABV9H2P2_9HYPH
MHRFLRCAISGIVGLFWAMAVSTTAQSGEKTFGSFSITDAEPGIIALKGAIEPGAALDFRRALRAAPDAKLVTLNSGGGSVHAGLIIADDIHQKGLSTYIPKTSKCYSACSYIFLAGRERKVDGELGVHQISSDSLVGAQLAISDIIEVLSRFDTPPEVMQMMFKTPPDDIHIFSQDEIVLYKLNRSAADHTANEAPFSRNQGPSIDKMEKTAEESEPGAAATAPAPPPVDKTETIAKLSPLEEFTRRPNRIALYAGLDLFGEDIASMRVEDVAVCARNCLTMNGQCKAFTFNINPRIKKGPNCFFESKRRTRGRQQRCLVRPFPEWRRT